jgi:hypothetical protein
MIYGFSENTCQAFFTRSDGETVPRFSANRTLLPTAYEAGQFDDKPFETTE